MAVPENLSSKSLRNLVWALMLCAAGVSGVLALAWVGFIGSDDMEYYLAGRALSSSFWNAPEGFGGMRSAVSMPIALSLKAFGDHEWALILPSSLYALATAAVSLIALARFIPLSAALIVTLLFMTLPVVAITSTMASADVAELFWSVCAFWLAIEATRNEERQQAGLMIVSGACIALAFAARETSAALIIWLGVGFLFGFGLPRLKYLWSAVGFLGVMAAECAYFAISVGDPLVRFRALVETRAVASRLVVPPFTFDDTGNLRIHALIDPLVMLLTKHSFGGLYWILLALALFAWFWRKDPNDRPAALPAASAVVLPALALGLIWTVFAALVLIKLRIHARYYLAPTYFLMVAASLWLAGRFGSARGRRLAGSLIVVLALGNMLGIWLDNRNPRFAERALAEMAMRYDQPIHTDAATAYIAATFLHWNGGRPEQIVSTPPGAGDLSFRVLSGIGSANRQRTGSLAGEQRGEVLESRGSPPLLTGELATRIKASPFVPGAISNKLTASRSSAQLIRVVSGDGTSAESIQH